MKKIHHVPSGEINKARSHNHLMIYFYSVAYLGPSVTTYTYNNPAYRIYELQNDTTYQVFNHHVYFFNMTAANSENDTTWQYLYGAKVR